MSYDLCEYNNSHLGMRRQSQALRLVIKQATNAKPVSQANKPQRSLSRRTLRNSDVASKSKDFFVNMRVAVLDTTKKPLAPTTPRIHRSDGYEYQGQIKNGSRANAKQQKALGHSTTLP